MDKAVEAKRAGAATPAPAAAGSGLREVEIRLYAKRAEIYPRHRIGDSLGYFQKWSWALVWATQIVF